MSELKKAQIMWKHTQWNISYEEKMQSGALLHSNHCCDQTPGLCSPCGIYTRAIIQALRQKSWPVKMVEIF